MGGGADAGEDLAALAIQVSASQFHGQTYAGGSLSLETAASWRALVAEQERRLAPLAMYRTLRRLPGIVSELPLVDLDERLDGSRGAVVPRGHREPRTRGRVLGVQGFRRRRRAGLGPGGNPSAGRYDIFLPWMLEDFKVLRDAGREPQLVIGPWDSTSRPA